MLLNDFSYALPEELIAQEPLAERDQSRLLVVDRKTQAIEHKKFSDMLDYLNDDDLMVFNNTRVVATRIHGIKETGGNVEALLMKRIAPGLWEAMVKPGRRVQVGTKLIFDCALRADVVERTVEGGRILRLEAETDPDELVGTLGQVPLPPYIHKRLDDPQRYQTVYAEADGSAAAPTAGLHFTPALLEKIRNKGIKMAFVTLHIGIATFRPVRTENIEDHEMHTENYEINEACEDIINSAQGRIVCVGTTTARALESAAVAKRRVAPGAGKTDIFIKPPYDFKIVEALITNFHVPKSTLLIMISALAGTALIRKAYEEAVRERYRFLSFGD
ncbi:MAG: tRNA preQ1(34) S-adenosylmethionine ribosyltransferase-isomerase QueA, partial [Armatimonadetes bacterium]|nr:tRNA preQ1(34) S-adenosylmethionine ribosyltransferase-isomerase QueA [Armatimonadota bacterium]